MRGLFSARKEAGARKRSDRLPVWADEGGVESVGRQSAAFGLLGAAAKARRKMISELRVG